MLNLALSNGMVASSFYELEREELLDVDGGSWWVDALMVISAGSTIAGALCGVAAVACPPLALGFAVAGVLYATDAAVAGLAAYYTSR